MMFPRGDDVELDMTLFIFAMIRIATLTSERVAFNKLGRAGGGSLSTMGIGFGGAAIILWVVAVCQGTVTWQHSTWWTGAIYALAFGCYTVSIVRGKLSIVSQWSNATVVLLWLLHPEWNLISLLGISLFSFGALLLVRVDLSKPVLLMIASDILLACARYIDVQHANEAVVPYSASLFTVISVWMFAMVAMRGKLWLTIQMVRRRPAWSFIAASSNAAAYACLLWMLRFLHPAAVEAISALASATTWLCGVLLLHEGASLRKIISSSAMLVGSVLLLAM